MRAILLAAGMGTRLRPLTAHTPKSLIEVNGKPLLERQIEALLEVGINDIIVVTGYLKEKFDYLVHKYNVKLVHNDKYNLYNNIYTMYLVKDYLRDSYVIDADVYINKNFFKKEMKYSTYFSEYKMDFKDEWKIIYDEDNNIRDIDVTTGDGHILCGVSYWNKNDGDFIINKLSEKIKESNFTDLYWDNIVKENIKNLNVKIEKLEQDSIFEIDNLIELEDVKKRLYLFNY